MVVAAADLSLGDSDLYEFEPDVLGSYLVEARDPSRGDAYEDGGESCDAGDGSNWQGNIQYFPRERYKPGKDGCRATGAVANYLGRESAEDGTSTVGPRRADADTGARWLAPPGGFNELPGDPPWSRARGHLIGRQLGGSGTELRNLVPLHAAANSGIMSQIESRVLNRIATGQSVRYEVTPVYGGRATGVPAAVHIKAAGTAGLNVDCYVLNKPDWSAKPICSSEEYGR